MGREGLDTSAIAGVIGMSGPYDFYPFDAESTKLAFGGAEDPLATQPMSFARADAPPMLLVQGEKDTLVGPRNARVLAKAITEAGGQAAPAMYADMAHNGPVLALASPWRRDRELIEAIKAFTSQILAAPTPATGTAADAGTEQASVPVQAENR